MEYVSESQFEPNVLVLDIFGVLSEGARTVLRDRFPLLGIALLFSVADVAWDYLSEWPRVADSLVLNVLFSLPLFFVQGLCVASIATAMGMKLKGRAPTIPGVLAHVGSRFKDIAGLAALVPLAVLAGTLCLILPGLVVATALWVAIPALLLEGTTIRGAIRRSRDLTSGFRLPIFFVWILLGILYSLGEYLFVAGAMVVDLNQGVALVGYWLFRASTNAISSVCAVLVYFRLRDMKGDTVQIDADPG